MFTGGGGKKTQKNTNQSGREPGTEGEEEKNQIEQGHRIRTKSNNTIAEDAAILNSRLGQSRK